jgi:hypothetical protein
MSIQKNIKILPLLTILIIITVFFIYLYKNINHYPLPNGDVFQYIFDGRQYINFKLPKNIHPAPAYPILICLVAKIFPNVDYPELYSAQIINIVLSTLILLNVFLLLYKHSFLLSLATVFLLATNKIYFLTSIDVTNEIVFSFFLTLNILLYKNKHFKIAYLLSGLLFLIRYESILFQMAIFIIEFFYDRKQFKLKNIIISFTPVIVWLIILNSHSTGDSITQNTYIAEIYNGLKDIPNLVVVKSFIDLILFNSISTTTYKIFGNIGKYGQISNLISYLFTICLFLISLLKILKKNYSITLKIVCLTLIFFIVFMPLFPKFCLRYLIPVVWIIYLVIFDQKNKFIKIILISSLIIFNVTQLNAKSEYDYQDGYEFRYAADWMNKQNFNKSTRVLIYDPITVVYFIKNSNIIMDFSSYESYNLPNVYKECKDNMACVAKNLFINDPFRSKIIVISTAYSSLPIDVFADKETTLMHHMQAFRNFPTDTDKKYFKLIDEIGTEKNWVKIYQYISS